MRFKWFIDVSNDIEIVNSLYRIREIRRNVLVILSFFNIFRKLFIFLYRSNNNTFNIFV